YGRERTARDLDALDIVRVECREVVAAAAGIRRVVNPYAVDQDDREVRFRAAQKHLAEPTRSARLRCGDAGSRTQQIENIAAVLTLDALFVEHADADRRRLRQARRGDVDRLDFGLSGKARAEDECGGRE